ncbi:MAG: FixH family protein [Flavobacteriales bacterium]
MRFRNGIIIAMVAFVAFIVTLALVINSKDSELISEDYYIKEKNFNQDFDAQQRAADHQNPIKVENQANGIFFRNTSNLNIEHIDITFIRMNDGKSDFSVKNHDIRTWIPKQKLAKGNYEVQLRYQVNNEPYMQVTTWYFK